MKSKHKHLYVKHLRRHIGIHGQVFCDLVNVCSICGKVKDVPLSEQTIKVDSGWRWLLREDEIRELLGDFPVLEEGPK